MKLWIDADACPVAIREIILRAAKRTGYATTFVANHAIPVPRLPNVRFQQVAKGFDVADHFIAQRVEAGDLVITQDIPLAADVIEKGAQALSPRGEHHTRDNIRARLNIRDFMDSLRSSGIETGGPPALSASDRKAFADVLDRLLAQKTP